MMIQSKVQKDKELNGKQVFIMTRKDNHPHNSASAELTDVWKVGCSLGGGRRRSSAGGNASARHLM